MVDEIYCAFCGEDMTKKDAVYIMDHMLKKHSFNLLTMEREGEEKETKSPFTKILEAVTKGELMGNCLTAVLEFVESKGLSDELIKYLAKREDPYFLLFIKKTKRKEGTN